MHPYHIAYSFHILTCEHVPRGCRCVQVSRMEAGDHWIVYGKVEAGKLNSEELTAVHHRKVGNHY